MGWNAGEEVVPDAAPVREDDLATAGLEVLNPAPRMEADALRANGIGAGSGL
jgi:hypothetical protein